jgi:6-phosphogluconolactonase
MMERERSEIKVALDPSFLTDRAVEEFVRAAGEALQDGNLFTVALAGGSTPQQMYTRLAGLQLDWERIHFFWGDERCVPPNHPDSNYGMAYHALLGLIPISTENIHRIHGELPAQEAALDYEDTLNVFFEGAIPRFNLVLLGLGGDGHTASIFPGSPAVWDFTHRVVAVSHTVPPTPLVDRVTLTMPVLNAAARVVFLVAGADKAERLAEVLYGPSDPDLLPAQAVKPVNGTIYWLVDQAAASRFPGSG